MTCVSLMSLPGPAEFFRTISQDLLGHNCVVVGLPAYFSGDLMRSCFGQAIRPAGSAEYDPLRDAPRSSLVSEIICVPCPTQSLFYIDARASGEAVVADWNTYVGREGRMLDKIPTTVCVLLRDVLARRCRDEKHFRRRLWCDYVTGLDSRVLAMDHVRQLDFSPEHVALKISLVEALCGTDLSLAEQYSGYSLRQLMNADDFSSHAIWSAQVSILFPLVDRERRRLLGRYDRLWRPPPGKSLLDLDISEVHKQAKGRKSIKRVDWLQIDWLFYVRNELAHIKCVPWEKLVESPIFKFG